MFQIRVSGPRTQDGIGATRVCVERGRAEQEESPDGDLVFEENAATVIIVIVFERRLPEQRRISSE